MSRASPARSVVVGAGVAGLACAIELLRGGHGVTLVEQAHHTGGRARSFHWEEAGCDVDTGPHLVLGCYRSFRKLLEQAGCPLQMEDRLRVELRCARDPTPVVVTGGTGRLRNLWSLLSARGISARDRLAIVRGMLRASTLMDTTTVEEWLDQSHQPASARRLFWEPLAVAVLNRCTAAGDSRQLYTVIRRAFLDSDADGRLGRAGKSLSDLYVRPVTQAVERLGGDIVLGEGVESFEIVEGRIRAATGRSGRRFEADSFVSALPPDALARLLGDPALQAFEPSPIVSVHVLSNTPLALPATGFLGLLESPFHWLFQIPAGDRWVASLSTSDARDLLPLKNEELTELALRTLREFFPKLLESNVLASRAVRERSATYHLPAGQEWRGLIGQPANLVIAGDWTEPDYPCTIESAARSGYSAAQALLSRQS